MIMVATNWNGNAKMATSQPGADQTENESLPNIWEHRLDLTIIPLSLQYATGRLVPNVITAMRSKTMAAIPIKKKNET